MSIDVATELVEAAHEIASGFIWGCVILAVGIVIAATIRGVWK